MKYKAQVIVLPEELQEVYSAIKYHIGNDDWPMKPEVDNTGNTPEDIFRLWIARKIEDTFTAVFEPVEGRTFHTNLLKSDILNFLDHIYGPNPLDDCYTEWPRTFGTFFDLKPLTKTTLIIYDSERAPKASDIRNKRIYQRPKRVPRITSRIQHDGSTVVTIDRS